MRLLLSVLLATLILAATAAADEILLKNGNVIIGKIIHEDAENVIIRISSPLSDDSGDAEKFIEMSFPKSNVRRITRDANFFQPIKRKGTEEEKKPEPAATPTEPPEPTPPVTPTSPDTPTTGAGTETAAETTPATDKEPEPLLDPALQKQVDSYIESLGTMMDEEKRKGIEQRLAAIGEDVGPTVILALKKGGPDFKRISLIRILERLRDKRGVRELIEQLKGMRTNTIRMRFAYQTLMKITGHAIKFEYEVEDNKYRAKQVQAWEEWFTSVKDQYPEQVGYEEKKDKGGDTKTP